MELRYDTFKQVSCQETVRCGLLLRLIEDFDQISQIHKSNGGKNKQTADSLHLFCMRNVVIAESLACLNSAPRAQSATNKPRALSPHTCPICRRRSFPLAPRAELRLNWLSAVTRPGCLNHRVALIERWREGKRAAQSGNSRISGSFMVTNVVQSRQNRKWTRRAPTRSRCQIKCPHRRVGGQKD